MLYWIDEYEVTLFDQKDLESKFWTTWKKLDHNSGLKSPHQIELELTRTEWSLDGDYDVIPSHLSMKWYDWLIWHPIRNTLTDFDGILKRQFLTNKWLKIYTIVYQSRGHPTSNMEFRFAHPIIASWLNPEILWNFKIFEVKW